jgi:hypothetical protein
MLGFKRFETAAVTIRGIVLRGESAAVANGIAGFLLYLREHKGKVPHAYFNWTEGNPLLYLLHYVLSGDGDVAP